MKLISKIPLSNLLSLGKLGRVALTAFVLLAVPVAGFAQDTTGAIRGKIYDDAGNPIVNADVVVEDMRTNVQRRYSSNASGTFFATKLSVGGPYRVTVDGAQPVIVPLISLGDTYSLTINLSGTAVIEEIVVTATTSQLFDVATGPTATFSAYDLDNAVAFDRDIKDVYSHDPRLNLDTDGFQVNCGGRAARTLQQRHAGWCQPE